MRIACVVVALLGSAAAAQKRFDPGKGSLTRKAADDSVAATDRSHSEHGKAFDQGPRQQAHLMRGIGNVHFPVTTSKPEAQRFFDQGINLLYCFFWFEAERAFRHAAMLDPDCAMAYWGMAMADFERGKEFIKLAVAKKEKVTDRERRYIDALAINYREGGDDNAKTKDNLNALERLVIAYPDDIEAKAIYAWALNNQSGGSRVAVDALLKEALAKNPLHPGANHYRIHLWDGADARMALDSAKAFPKGAPEVGHAQHMPGHIYAQVGRFEEAAYAMDAGARAERRYFYSEGHMPWESWNYAHNEHYLVSNIGYTGRIAEGIRLAQELLDIPHDPQYNSGDEGGPAGQGRFAMMRMRIRGERWDEILNDPDPGWKDASGQKSWRAYTRGMAFLGKGDRDSARKELAALEETKAGGDAYECSKLELRGRLAIADGDLPKGIEELKKAADIEKQHFAYSDPPPYPRPLYESLAWAYLQAGRWADAESAAREGLSREPGNGFAIALLVESLARAGRKGDAERAYEDLKLAWGHADAGLPALRRLLAMLPSTGAACGAGEDFGSPFPRLPDLERIGPARWRPFPAPGFTLTDPNGKSVRLEEFRGKNLILIFYLGGACPHCAKQLEGFGAEIAKFKELNTALAAVSSDTPATNRAFLAANPSYPLLLLSDKDRRAARKYKAVDDFENLDLHATVLIDRKGRIWWFRSGSEPFTDVKFLESEIKRMDSWALGEGRKGSPAPVRSTRSARPAESGLSAY